MSAQWVWPWLRMSGLYVAERCKPHLVSAAGDNSLAGFHSGFHDHPLSVRRAEAHGPPDEFISTGLDVDDLRTGFVLHGGKRHGGPRYRCIKSKPDIGVHTLSLIHI